MTMTLHSSKCALHSPNRIIAKRSWNESAEQEKRFDKRFVGVGVTTSGSDDMIITNSSKTVS